MTQTEIKPKALTIQDVIKSAVEERLITIEDCQFFDDHYGPLGAPLKTMFKQMATYSPRSAIRYLKFQVNPDLLKPEQTWAASEIGEIPIHNHEEPLRAKMKGQWLAIVDSPVGLIEVKADRSMPRFFALAYSSPQNFWARSTRSANCAKSAALCRASRANAEVDSVHIYALKEGY